MIGEGRASQGSSRTPQEKKAALLRDLHHRERPLLLPNSWDVAGARLVEAAGFPIVATSSWAVAASLGYEDDDCMRPDEAFGAIGRVARGVDVPVTGDIEAGYRLEPGEIVDRLVSAGAVGCNFEDTDHHGPRDLVEREEQAARIEGLRKAADKIGVPIVINARVDVALDEESPSADLFEEAVARAIAYAGAGADCVYPIRLSDERLIGEFVQRVGMPVNIMLREPGPSLQRLSELGVARVSLAAGMMRRAYGALRSVLEDLRAQWDGPPG